jgi:hypothetical protein
MGLMVCLISLSFVTLGFAGVPDRAASTATTALTEIVSVFTNVNGQGRPLNGARVWNQVPATLTDATVTLNVIDTFGFPIFQYPFEDMWLETADGGLKLCNGGSTADASTDVNGQTTFSRALFAGGGSAYNKVTLTYEPCIVMIDGTALSSVGSEMSIIFNSADLNGNKQVGVEDTVLFKPLYIAGTQAPFVYDYKIDFYFDHQITLSDLVLYAGVSNTVCP